MSREDLYSQHAETIDAVIAAVCRRHRLTADRAEELGSEFRLKLIEHDYEVLARFQGRSSIRTYLVAVCERLLLDIRTREWGKWRPCQEAKRLGPLAVELDRLVTRDGVAYEEAVERLLAEGRAATRAELDEIRPRLAPRTRKWMVSGEVLEHTPARGSADERVVADERARQVSKTGAALREALESLAPQDRLILRLRFQDKFTVARIAELMGEAQKPLYGRFERLFALLRERLATLGVSKQEARDLLSESGLDLPGDFFGGPPRNDSSGPSMGPAAGGRHA